MRMDCKYSLGAKGEFDWDAAFHGSEDAPDDGPVHGVAESAAHLIEVLI